MKNLQIVVLALLVSVAGTASAQKVEQVKPWLGVAIEAGKVGVAVKDVIAGTPAAEYGLKAGDEITAIGGTKVSKPEELIQVVRSQGVGNTVKVEYLRAGKSETKDVKLVARPDELELVKQRVVGKQAPAFVLDRIHGDAPVTQATLKGKVAVVEFWATWCPACRASHPRLSKWAAEMKKKNANVAVLAVSDEEEAELKNYAKMVAPDFTIARDKEHALQKEWYVSAIPMTVVMDKTGKVTFATIGAGSYLEEALAEAEKLAR